MKLSAFLFNGSEPVHISLCTFYPISEKKCKLSPLTYEVQLIMSLVLYTLKVNLPVFRGDFTKPLCLNLHSDLWRFFTNTF